jgi:hypothetical protein
MAILSYKACALWLLGYPQAALADIDRAVKAAREIGDAATLMYALTHAAWTHLWSGDSAARSDNGAATVVARIDAQRLKNVEDL